MTLDQRLIMGADQRAMEFLMQNSRQALIVAAELRQELVEANLAGSAPGLSRAEAAAHQASELARCRDDLEYFFDTYICGDDPRRLGDGVGSRAKIVLWPAQRQIMAFMQTLLADQSEGLIEKSRDVGASTLACGFLLHCWLFKPGFKGTLASRKLDAVDKKDNPDSLFQKLRTMLFALPRWMLPKGFNRRQHARLMLLVNPETEAIVSGEGGDQMGRGGRSSIYIVDEASYIPNSDDIEASISGNADCVLWISTPRGPSNLFAQKRFSLPAERIARLHYTDDPRKTPEWISKKKAQMRDAAKWASEYEIDYNASLDGICIPSAWVSAAQSLADLVPELCPDAFGVGGLDVGGGKSKSVFVARHGPVVTYVASRGDADTTGTAYWGLDLAQETMCTLLNYDSPGVGAGVQSILENRRIREENGQEKESGVKCQAVNTGTEASRSREWPNHLTSYETFANKKTEVWWMCATRCRNSYEYKLWLGGHPDGVEHKLSELLVLPKDGPDARQLAAELSAVRYFRTESGKLILETKKQLRERGVQSPDYADALMLTFIDPPEEFEWYVGA